MYRRIFALVLALLALPCAARAQTVAMRAARLSFDYPESWLVVSPQLALVYAPLLGDAGIDAQALSSQMTGMGVHSRAYNADFSEWISVMTMDGDLAAEIFEMGHVQDAQRRQLKSLADANGLWETTGLRKQDSQWQREGGVYWLYVHYTRTVGDETVGRGVRYITVHNGQYVILDWQTNGRRFTNADLRRFRAMLSGLTVTESLPEPVRSVELAAQLPTETSKAAFTVGGTATPGASMLLTVSAGNRVSVSVTGTADAKGSFSLKAELPGEGAYSVSLTAGKEGMTSASVTGTLAYDATKLPVSLTGVQEGGVTTVTGDTTAVTGETLAGVEFQLVSPYGLTRKRAGNDGSFAFELTTKEAGEYHYTLICDKEGFDQRRIEFTINRVLTEEQSREQVRGEAEGISYRELQKDKGENRGKTLRIYGPVVEVSQSGDVQYVRMHYNRDAQGRWYNPVIVTANQDMHVKAGDMLTVVASVAGVYEEQDEDGNPVIVPRLELLFVDAVE